MDGCCINHTSADALMSMLQMMKVVIIVLLMKLAIVLLMKMGAKVMKAKV